MANAKLTVVEKIVSIEVTTQPSNKEYYFYTAKATESLTVGTLTFDPTGMKVTATQSSGTTRVLNNANLTYSAIPAKAGEQIVTITAEKGITATVEVNVTAKKADEVTNTSNIVGAEDNSSGFFTAFSDDFKVESGKTKAITFTNYTSRANNWSNFLVVLRETDTAKEYVVVRADNYGWGNGYAACKPSGPQANCESWLAEMDGAEVTVFVTNNGDGTADIRTVMKGNKGTIYTQDYIGINTIKADDLNFALSVEKCHLVFNK